jgi:hypothetical protein
MTAGTRAIKAKHEKFFLFFMLRILARLEPKGRRLVWALETNG